MSALQESLQSQAGPRPVFDLVQSYTLAHVLAALEMAGLLSELEGAGLALEATRYQHIDGTLLEAIVAYLAQRGLVAEMSGLFRLTSLGHVLCRDKGYLVWLSGGYGTVLRQLDAFLQKTMSYGSDTIRDGRWVATGSALIGKHDVVPYARQLLKEISFEHALDLGCGNAKFLISVCQAFNCSGVGVDISPEACKEAEQAVHAAELETQVRIVQTDAADLHTIPALTQTQLVIAFFLLHEIFAQGQSVLLNYLRRMCSLLPAGAHFLIAEVTPPRFQCCTPEWFTPEFSLLHAVMGQSLPSQAIWQDLLRQAGLMMKQAVPLDLPGGVLLLCQVPQPA